MCSTQKICSWKSIYSMNTLDPELSQWLPWTDRVVAWRKSPIFFFVKYSKCINQLCLTNERICLIYLDIFLRSSVFQEAPLILNLFKTNCSIKTNKIENLVKNTTYNKKQKKSNDKLQYIHFNYIYNLLFSIVLRLILTYCRIVKKNEEKIVAIFNLATKKKEIGFESKPFFFFKKIILCIL